MFSVETQHPGQEHGLRLAFSCEAEKFKVNYLLEAFPDAPLFTDMKELPKGKAFDARSKTVRDVPKAL